MNHRLLAVIALTTGAIALSYSEPPTVAQVTSAPDGLGTIVTGDGQQFWIDGGTLAGANLFHSFQQFGLDTGQIATFLAQPQLANILARVSGGEASVINGLIQVTGGTPNLYLMNPAGLLLGATASLNVPADFLATTATGIGLDSGGWFNATGPLALAQLTGSPAQFAFDASAPAPLVNAGQLAVNPGQNLTLLAGQVINTGSLTAPGGQITLSAVPGSSRVRLSQTGHLLSLEIEPPRTASGDLEAIQVLDLPTLLTGSGVETGLTTTGNTLHFTASGQSVNLVPGLTAVTGSLEVSQDRGAGGAIAVLGDRVALFSATLEASGATGGGHVRIGGDYKGSGPLPNARRTLVDAHSRIRAEAREQGDGGRVILWADEATGFWGEISARGGPQGGDGGFVEVSGKQHLTFRGAVDVSANSGQAGTLLLDPFNIFIIDDNGPNDFELSDGQILFGEAPGSSLVISAAEIENVTGILVLEAANDIVVAPGVDLEFGSFLSLALFIADADGDGQGGFFMSPSDSIFTNGADLVITGAEIQVGRIETGSDFRNSGDVVLVANTRETGSNITFTYIDTSNDDGYAAGDVLIAAYGTVRGTGFNERGQTIDAVGDAGGGLIYIEHNGGPLGLPFVVGDASQNGLAGGLLTNTTSIQPRQRFSEPGLTVIGDVTINFTGQDALGDLDDDFWGQLEEGFDWGDWEDWDDWDDLDFEDFTAAETDVDFDLDYDDWEADFTDEFLDFLNEVETPEAKTLEEAQAILGDIARQTGEIPALFYFRYTPAAGRATPSPPTAQPATPWQAGDLVARGSAELWRFDRFGGNGSDWSQTASEAGEGSPDDVLEVAIVFAEGRPVRRLPGATRAAVEAVAAQFRQQVANPRSRQAWRAPAQQLYQWFIAPIEADLQARGVTNLAFVLAAGLRSLPLAALFDGEQLLIERYSLGQMPSLSLTDTDYRPLQDLSVLAMGASEFDEQPPLPAVPLELQLVAGQLWPGQQFLNQDFTANNLKAARNQGAYGLVHLGTHGEFQPGRLTESFLWLGNEKLPLTRLRELSLNQPPTELLVLSACRTALGDREAELGFAGLAVQSGVKTAIGSLWYVSDTGTLAIMANLYAQLRQAPIKAEALRQAQLALLRGETYFANGQLVTATHRFDVPPSLLAPGRVDLSHPYFWSAFTAIGSPW